MSTWKDLLNEFSDEGVVDCNIHNHDLEKPGLVGDSSGLTCLRKAMKRSKQWHCFSHWLFWTSGSPPKNKKTCADLRRCHILHPAQSHPGLSYDSCVCSAQTSCEIGCQVRSMFGRLIFVSLLVVKLVVCICWQTYYSWTAPATMNGLKYASVASAFNIADEACYIAYCLVGVFAIFAPSCFTLLSRTLKLRDFCTGSGASDLWKSPRTLAGKPNFTKQ